MEGSNCGWRGGAVGLLGWGGPGPEGAQDPGGAQGGRRRRTGAWGEGVSRRFTRSRAPSTPSGGTSGPRSWSAARRRRRGAATASGSALPARIRPNKYLQESREEGGEKVPAHPRRCPRAQTAPQHRTAWGPSVSSPLLSSCPCLAAHTLWFPCLPLLPPRNPTSEPLSPGPTVPLPTVSPAKHL